MKHRQGKNGKVTRLPIEGEMTIYRVHELREAILRGIDQFDEVQIDLSHVTETDAAGMQLLISAKRESILKGKTLRLVGHSQSVQDMFDLCALCGLFDEQAVPHARSQN